MIPKASDIKPKVKGQSDFFSWQLYRYMRKYTDPKDQRVFAGTWNSIDGVNPLRPVLYIGQLSKDLWFSGRQLRNLCRHGGSIVRYAYHAGHDTKNWVDVTDAFWSDYMKIGVCAIHGDLAHDWDVSGDERTCRYCGKREIKRIKMVEKEIWV